MEDVNADLEAGYNDTPTETPDPEVQPVLEEAKTDPLADIVARIERFENSQNTLAGHIGGLTRTQKALQQTLEASRAASVSVQAAPTNAEVKAAIENPKEWESLKDDFPEWATATEKYLESRLSGIPSDKGLSPAEIEKAVSEIVDQRVKSALAANASTALEAVYEDWQDDVKTPEFDKWYKSQSQEIQGLAQSSRVKDAKRMLTLFYNSQKPVEKQTEKVTRPNRFTAAVTPRGTGGANTGPSAIDEIEAGYNAG